jgi:hypothetical protein
MDVEPMGDEFVVTMCHDIEDPTFDATAAATNPRARMRPVHRPPRMPADRTPHCLWSVTIDQDAESLPFPAQAERIATSRAASMDIPTVAGDSDDGCTDYNGPLQADLDFGTFSRETLVALLNEVALQGHLLTLAFADAVERRSDAATSADIVRKQFTGIAGVAASRIAKALGTKDITTVLGLHPAFHPRTYIDVTLNENAIVLNDCPALGDRPGRSWADVLAGGADEPLDAIVQAVDPRARVARRSERAWDVRVGPEPLQIKREVRLTRMSTGADFAFEDRS